jgi:hypothetical protein
MSSRSLRRNNGWARHLGDPETDGVTLHQHLIVEEEIVAVRFEPDRVEDLPGKGAVTRMKLG